MTEHIEPSTGIWAAHYSLCSQHDKGFYRINPRWWLRTESTFLSFKYTNYTIWKDEWRWSVLYWTVAYCAFSWHEAEGKLLCLSLFGRTSSTFSCHACANICSRISSNKERGGWVCGEMYFFCCSFCPISSFCLIPDGVADGATHQQAMSHLTVTCRVIYISRLFIRLLAYLQVRPNPLLAFKNGFVPGE